MFEQFKVFETTLAGRPLKVETGKMAQLSGGSCLVRYGDTVVLCNATMSDKPRDGVDFFPLSVDYEEKLYAVGRIPGSFQRREGRPSEKAILTSRVIDRPIRPLFPKDMRNDVSVVCTVMSVDPDCSPEITAMIGASIAISISSIPWDGPISGVIVGLVDGEYVINPTAEQEARSDMHVTVASTADLVAMIEAGANESRQRQPCSDGNHGRATPPTRRSSLLSMKMQAEIGKPKVDFHLQRIRITEMYEAVKAISPSRRSAQPWTPTTKRIRDARLRPIYDGSARQIRRRVSRAGRQCSTNASISCRNMSCAAGCWMTASAWMAAASTKSVPWPPRSASCPGSTVPACSPAARPRCSPSRPSAPSGDAQMTGRHRSARNRKAVYASLQFPVLLGRGNPVLAAAPAAVRSDTAPWPNAPCSRSSPRLRNSPTPCVWSREVLSSNGSTSQAFDLRLHPGPDGRGRADQGAGGRHFLRPRSPRATAS